MAYYVGPMLPTPPPGRFVIAMLLALTAAAAEVEAKPAAPAPADTRLVAGDLLRIEVFDHPDLAISVWVPASGVITYPLIGEVR